MYKYCSTSLACVRGCTWGVRGVCVGVCGEFAKCGWVYGVCTSTAVRPWPVCVGLRGVYVEMCVRCVGVCGECGKCGWVYGVCTSTALRLWPEYVGVRGVYVEVCAGCVGVCWMYMGCVLVL